MFPWWSGRLGRLIGRDDELKIIGDALVTCPVVTLVGPGGIGKTRLALAAARRVVADDGAWLIDLAEIGSPGDVPRAVAGPLGIKEGQGRPLAESIVVALRPRQLLLARSKIDASLPLAADQPGGLSFDDRQALEYMRRMLRQLATGQDPAS